MKRWAIFILILFFDFSTKYWVAHHLPLIQLYTGFPFGGIGIIDTLLFKASIVHTTNTGTAWGFLSNFQGLLLYFRIFIAAGILGFLLFFKPPQRLLTPLICILAGAVGNIIDFFLYGHVIDMIYLIFYKYSYPIFNIADSAIFLSVAYLLFVSRKVKFRSHASSD